MRQVWISKAGGPDVLQVRDAPDLQPGPGEVRIAVEAIGVNFADVMGRLGIYPDAPRSPFVPGYEVAGRIDAVGAGVDASRAGEDVLARTLGPLHAEDYSRAEYQVIFRGLEQALVQVELAPLDYLYQWLPPELVETVDRLRVSPLDQFGQVLSRLLVTELASIVRAQERVNTLPALNTPVFVREALLLRQSRLERESSELYFLQQDARSQGDHEAEAFYQAQIDIHSRTRGLLARTLRAMRAATRSG